MRQRIKAFLLYCLNRFFKPEEINGGGLCPTYLYRWTLLTLWGGRKLYLHRFVADDWSADLHDHPKRFTSIGLRGSYEEIYAVNPSMSFHVNRKVFIAPWYRVFAATHTHRIQLLTPEVWTLCYTGKTERRWGFWQNLNWIEWRRYVGSDRAKQMKTCGGDQ